jgi:hypothetical protein
MNFRNGIRIIAAAVAVGAIVGGSAFAQPTYQHQVNISGATLFANFFSAPAGTNDWIDVNGDGIWGYNPSNYQTPQQLALDWNLSGSTYFCVQTRGVGSGTGFAELENWYNLSPTVDGEQATTYYGGVTDNSFINQEKWGNATGYIPGGYGSATHAGTCPVDPCSVDIAVMDVPPIWFVTYGTAADANWSKMPTQSGYGTNKTTSWTTSQSNAIKSLIATRARNGFKQVFNLNTSNPDANTIFDNQIAWVPIAYIVNPGVGISGGNITQQQLQYLYMTGRMPTGENLVACTRDSGSGTRNAAMNSLGMDPSWGRGDNIGTKSSALGTDQLGKIAQPTNLDGTSLMGNAVMNRRLGIGYIGMTNAASDIGLYHYEALNIKKTGASQFVHPNLNSALHNANVDTGWQYGGNETFATVGDPMSDSAQYPMGNVYAAKYLKNIVQSIHDFLTLPDATNADSNTIGMPGRFMAQNWMLAAALDAVPSNTNPTQFSANQGLVQSIQDFIVANNSQYNVGDYGTAGTGVVPTRLPFQTGDANTYADHQKQDYKDVMGNTVYHGHHLGLRNKIMGDFNGSHVRNINQIPQMMVAYINPSAMTNKGTASDNISYLDGNASDSNYVCPAIIGDFDGDGNFNADDIRYFADGLAIDPATGKVNRATGFTMVDQNWTAALAALDANHPIIGNYFNTTLARGSYVANSGASRADIAGKAGKTPTPGAFLPAADGKVDDKDIDYLNYVLRGGYKMAALGQTPAANPAARGNVWDFANPAQAPFMDLSCDMNGDNKIDSTDVDYIVHTVLGTNYGDVNLDGKVDFKDFAIIANNLGKGDGSFGKSTSAGWAMGDTDGDGFVTVNDVWAIAQNWLAGY